MNYSQYFKKIINYTLIYSGIKTSFKKAAFNMQEAEVHISDNASETAKDIRGKQHPPALMIHGVMPRSGTVYTGELFRLHPDIYAYPKELWETPFLDQMENVLRVQKGFFSTYKKNIGKIGSHDFLPLFGASFIAYLYSFVPSGRSMLLKVPSVDYLHLFFSVFPFENILLLMRDGRDLVSSTIKTWPRKGFIDTCRIWNYSTRAMLDFYRSFKDVSDQCWMVKYEDVLSNPQDFIEKACSRYGLEYSKFPADKINKIPVRGSSTLSKSGKVAWEPVKKPDNFKTVGHWKNWSGTRKYIFKKIAGQTLIDAGYCDDMEW